MRHRANLVACVLKLDLDQAGVAEKGLPLLGQGNSAWVPGEERTIQRGFQSTNGLGQARLGHAECSGCGAETAVASDCIEIADLGDFHEPIPYGYGNSLGVILS